jgi:predicted metal-binding membrane protein
MTTTRLGSHVPFSAITLALIGLSAVAWTGTVAWARSAGMGAMPGTMGMDLMAFVAMWSLMMTAMMLPSVGPLVGVYQRTITEFRLPRLVGLGLGYLVVWAAVGVGAFAIATWFGDLAAGHETATQVVAVATFCLVGVYQLSPLKSRCLSHCRTPVGHMLHYLGFQGTLRDVRAGFSHGWYCLGCCWALMVLMVAFGVMNIAAMVALTAIIAIEKVWRHGERFARIIGAASIAYAVALIFVPELAPGLDPGGLMPMQDMSAA